MQVEHYMRQHRQVVEEALEHLLPPADTPPSELHQAMRYSVLAPGKRLRPILVIASAEAVGGCAASVLPAACALECIHAFSLIHDDLPCMDDDDLRRGKPTLHKVYGEGVAVLAGDALYALAFEVIARCGSAAVVAEVARATGTDGMIGGQVADVVLEGEEIDSSDLEYIHNHKTGSLITACLTGAAHLGDADPGEVAAVRAYGQRIGLAFQVVDDILDETGDAKTLGKNPGADKDRGKNTYPKIHGLDRSVKIALDLVEDAKKALCLPGRETIMLRMLADFVVQRVT